MNTLGYLGLSVLILFALAQASYAQLTANDFDFGPPLGSSGAEVVSINGDLVKIRLGYAPQHPTWPNKVNFKIKQHAKGIKLRLIVSFDSGTSKYAFNEYFQSFSYDQTNWRPVFWHQNPKKSPKQDTLDFPAFEQDQVYIGAMVPHSYLDYKNYVKGLAKKHVNIVPIGKHGLEVVFITDGLGNQHKLKGKAHTEYEQDLTHRWGIFAASQHPGEHNAHWRMRGMIDYLLSDSGKALRQHTVFAFVMYMVPEASANGWYRTTPEGRDMNRTYNQAGVAKQEFDSNSHPEEWQYWLDKQFEDHQFQSIWSIHTWPGKVDISVETQNEKDTLALGSWKVIARHLTEVDKKRLIKPMYIAKPETTTWASGPGIRNQMSSYLCEGGGGLYTKEDNLESGQTLMKALGMYYKNKAEKPLRTKFRMFPEEK